MFFPFSKPNNKERGFLPEKEVLLDFREYYNIRENKSSWVMAKVSPDPILNSMKTASGSYEL